jgi:exodeoxyribonuclease-5
MKEEIEPYITASICEVTTDEPLPAQEININKANLNNQQVRAFDGICQWAKKKHGLGVAVLIGYAGTGKTYTVQRIAKQLQSERFKICFTAPTHKATHVLESMASDADLNVTIMTIFKLLGLTIEHDHDGVTTINQNSESSAYKYDLIVVDECSMIGSELFDYIPQNTDTKFLFMGDPCQLPPIDKKANQDADNELPISPTFEISPQWHLTEVVRYDGAIFKYVTDIRENIEAAKLPLRKYKRRELEAMPSDEWELELCDRFKEVIADDSHPDKLRVLAWTNNRVQALNNLVRAEIYGANAKPYIKGERLIAKEIVKTDFEIAQMMYDDIHDLDWKERRWETGNSYTLMNSCAECTVESATQSSVTFFDGSVWNVWELVVETDLGDVATVNILDISEKEHCSKYFGGWKKQILDIPNTTPEYRKTRKAEWAKFYQHLDLLCLKPQGNGFIRKLQYAFALTIHQSQGSTFETVFADVSNVYGCKDIKLRNQLLYVQGSRASKELILLSKY